MSLKVKITAVADAIREKTKTTAKMTLSEMPSLIKKIQVSTESAGSTGNAMEPWLAKYLSGDRIIGLFTIPDYVTNSEVWSPSGYTFAGMKVESANTGNLNVIREGMFYKSELKKVDLNNTVTEIRSYAFKNCLSLTEITGSDAVKEICTSAFEGCASLKSISFKNVPIIYDYCFEGCNNLSEVSLPATTTVGDSAFRDCYNLSKITLPATTTVGDSAFQGCNNLSKITLPAVEKVERNAFAFPDYVNKDIYLPGKKPQFDSRALGYPSYSEPKYTTTFHVPAALVEEYKADAEISKFLQKWGQKYKIVGDA